MPPWLLILIEILCVGVLLAGIGMLMGIPAALVTAGVLGIWACESSPSGKDAARRLVDRKGRNK